MRHARSRLFGTVDVQGGFGEVAYDPAGHHRVITGAVRIEEALRGRIGVGVAAGSERGQHPAELGQGNHDVRTREHSDSFGLCCCPLGFLFVPAHSGYRREDGVGSRRPLGLTEFRCQASRLLRRRHRDAPVAESRGHAAVQNQHPREMPQPALGAKALDRRAEECHGEVERANDDCCRAQVPRGLRVAVAICRRFPQACQHVGRATERVGVGVDRQHPGVGCVYGAEPMHRVDEDLPRRGAGLDQPRARGDEPQQVELQVSIAFFAGVLGGGNQRGSSGGVAERAGLDLLVDPGGARPLERTRRELLDLAQQGDDNVTLPEFERHLGCCEQPSSPLRRLAELRGAPQRGSRDGGRSAPPRAAACLLEFHRDVVMCSGYERRSVPDAPVRVHAKRFGQRLVYT